MDLSDKVAVVTGGTKGIGYATARALGRAGATVVVSARSQGDVDIVSRELAESVGRPVHGIQCDVRDPRACAALIEGAVERCGGLDVLVNNAGVGIFAPIHELTIDQFRTQIETNLSGVFYCSKAAVPHLSSRDGGWIINIGSLAGRNAFARGTAYNASKFGLRGLTEAMMLDLRYDGIRVSMIMPGSVDTAFAGNETGDAAAWKLQADDIAQAVLDLLAYEGNALPSKIEMRPSQPPRR